MSSIRPLATIAVLAALGVFLAYKINEGPAVALNDGWAQPLGEEDPGEPPAWNGGDSAPTAIDAPPAGDSSFNARSNPTWEELPTTPEPPAPPESAPAFPALPDLPPVEGQPAGTEIATEPAAAPAFPNATIPDTTGQQLPLPDAIPQANYGDQAAADPPSITGRVPSLGSSTSLASEPASSSSAPGFDAAWEAIQAALARDELTRAHRMVSQWRAEPGLSPNQRQRVETLLGQLAGSVVYSTEHRLEPPHVVAPGETLGGIAAQYQVPWQLLAKINGIESADAVTPGQTIKVVRGPFGAEVDLKRGELTLLLDDRYAGRFPVRVEGAAPAGGDWKVGQKRLDESRRPLVGAVVPTAAAAVIEPKVVLENATGEKVELSASPTPPAGGRGRLAVASNDLADLYDILSVGSSVTIRR